MRIRASLSLLVFVVAATPSTTSAEATYIAALRLMRATREPAVAVYQAKLSVPAGGIIARRGEQNALYLRFGEGVNGITSAQFFVRTTSSSSTYAIELPDKNLAAARISLFNATWRGIDDWSRYGLYGNPDKDTPAPSTAPNAPSAEQDHVIAVVQSFGLDYYNATWGKPEPCDNGDDGDVILLTPRGDEFKHPLRSVTIDRTTGLFCTMHLVAPASVAQNTSLPWFMRAGSEDEADPTRAMANVTLHLTEVAGYYVVANEDIDIFDTLQPSHNIQASIAFDGFTFPGEPSAPGKE